MTGTLWLAAAWAAVLAGLAGTAPGQGPAPEPASQAAVTTTQLNQPQDDAGPSQASPPAPAVEAASQPARGFPADSQPAPQAETQPVEQGPPIGLSVDANGALLLHGRPYKGVGINYFELFLRTIRDGNDASTLAGLEVLAAKGVPFVRFNCGGFWAGEWELYRRDPNEYFRRLDRLVAQAERVGVGLVPSLFWFCAAVPDQVGEPVGRWADPNSKTHAFMRLYAERVIRRYKDSPAIWAWEFGNEYALGADLPNAAEHRPKANLRAGTPASRTAQDDLTGQAVVTALAEFAALARRLDGRRAILSGNSVPRPYAWHNWKEGSWTLDTPEQYRQMLLRDNPDPMDTLSIHLYPDPKGSFEQAVAKMDALIGQSMAASRAAGKPLFIGEFGASEQTWKDRQREMIAEQLALIVKHNVPLAAAWVFDLKWQEDTFNVTADNARAYVLELIVQANRKLPQGEERQQQ